MTPGCSITPLYLKQKTEGKRQTFNKHEEAMLRVSKHFSEHHPSVLGRVMAPPVADAVKAEPVEIKMPTRILTETDWQTYVALIDAADTSLKALECSVTTEDGRSALIYEMVKRYFRFGLSFRSSHDAGLKLI